MSSGEPTHRLGASAFVAIATDGLTDAERDVFFRELLAYSADGLRNIHGGRSAAEAVYSLADALVASTPG